MKITPIGINIDTEKAINNFYKTYQERKHAKICEETNFKTGYVSYEDGVFLPTGTYVLIKENGKKDKLGRIFHFKQFMVDIDPTLTDGTAIVNIFYDMNSSNSRMDLNNSLIYDFIYKNFMLNKHNKTKYLQVVSCEDITEDDKWQFVRVEYGNPDTKMFYMYGWKYFDGRLFSQKNTTSNKLNYTKKINKAVFIYKDVYTKEKLTNTEYKIKHHVTFVPYELEYLIILIFLLCITSIFKSCLFFWSILITWYLLKRRKLRDKYNG